MQETDSQLIAEIERLNAINEEFAASYLEREAYTRQHEELNALLMKILPGMAYQCLNDDNWTIIHVTENAYEVTGYRPGDLINNSIISYKHLIHPEDHDQVWQKVQARLEQRSTFHVEYRLITARGEEKLVTETGMGIYDFNGKLEKIVGFICDPGLKSLPQLQSVVCG